MNFKALLTLLAFISTADARALRQLGSTKVTICSPTASPGSYKTSTVSSYSARYYFYFYNAVAGSCTTVCADLCHDYSSFETSNGACTCKNPAVKSVTCGANAVLINDQTSCQCLQGYQGDPFTECTDIDECASSPPCASNQICSNNPGSFTCEPIKCSNPYGNPCGPGSACADAASGFTCTPQYNPNICPVGCGPNSSCVSGSCVCNVGYYRPNASLPCVVNP
jgi:Calcium-binding EGF domain